MSASFAIYKKATQKRLNQNISCSINASLKESLNQRRQRAQTPMQCYIMTEPSENITTNTQPIDLCNFSCEVKPNQADPSKGSFQSTATAASKSFKRSFCSTNYSVFDNNWMERQTESQFHLKCEKSLNKSNNSIIIHHQNIPNARKIIRSSSASRRQSSTNAISSILKTAQEKMNLTSNNLTAFQTKKSVLSVRNSFQQKYYINKSFSLLNNQNNNEKHIFSNSKILQASPQFSPVKFKKSKTELKDIAPWESYNYSPSGSLEAQGDLNSSGFLIIQSSPLNRKKTNTAKILIQSPVSILEEEQKKSIQNEILSQASKVKLKLVKQQNKCILQDLSNNITQDYPCSILGPPPVTQSMKQEKSISVTPKKGISNPITAQKKSPIISRRRQESKNLSEQTNISIQKRMLRPVTPLFSYLKRSYPAVLIIDSQRKTSKGLLKNQNIPCLNSLLQIFRYLPAFRQYLKEFSNLQNNDFFDGLVNLYNDLDKNIDIPINHPISNYLFNLLPLQQAEQYSNQPITLFSTLIQEMIIKDNKRIVPSFKLQRMPWFNQNEDEACSSFEDEVLFCQNNPLYLSTHGLLKYSFYCEECGRQDKSTVLDDYQIFNHLKMERTLFGSSFIFGQYQTSMQEPSTCLECNNQCLFKQVMEFIQIPEILTISFNSLINQQSSIKSANDIPIQFYMLDIYEQKVWYKLIGEIQKSGSYNEYVTLCKDQYGYIQSFHDHRVTFKERFTFENTLVLFYCKFTLENKEQ